jgi:SAM-dependent methyltransferase
MRAAVTPMTYYRADLALVHHLGFGFHAERCAPDILALLEPLLKHGGTVVELGCGSGLLTRYLVEAGHRVIATDASTDMLSLCREYVRGAERIAQLTLPDDPIPPADAIVSIGHALSYLVDEASVDRALLAAAEALRPGGILALDICDLEWGERRQNAANASWIGDDWALITQFSVPDSNRFVRQMATFMRNDDGTWRRDDERHDNILVDTTRIPPLLASAGLTVTVGKSFGEQELPAGLRTVIGRRPSSESAA